MPLAFRHLFYTHGTQALRGRATCLRSQGQGDNPGNLGPKPPHHPLPVEALVMALTPRCGLPTFFLLFLRASILNPQPLILSPGLGDLMPVFAFQATMTCQFYILNTFQFYPLPTVSIANISLLDIASLQTALPASSLILSNPGSIWQAVIVSKCNCDHVTVLL